MSPFHIDPLFWLVAAAIGICVAVGYCRRPAGIHSRTFHRLDRFDRHPPRKTTGDHADLARQLRTVVGCVLLLAFFTLVMSATSN